MTISAMYEATLPTSPNPQQVASVELVAGEEKIIGGILYRWYIIHGTKVSGETYSVMFLADRNPFDPVKRQGISIIRYILQMEGDLVPLEYIEKKNGSALLPLFRFVDELLPTGSTIDDYFDTGSYLGLPLTLVSTQEIGTVSIPTTDKLVLDTDFMIGTHRATQPGISASASYDTHYAAKFSQDDYKTMLNAGMNYFTVFPEDVDFIRVRPVWYFLNRIYWLNVGANVVRYPESLYQSNWRGMAQIVDEPASQAETKGYYDGCTTPACCVDGLQTLVQEQYNSRVNALKTKLTSQGISFGTLDLSAPVLWIWEFMDDTTWYQFQVYSGGIISETQGALYSYAPTVEDMAQYEISKLRGAARNFGTDWGVGIYKWFPANRRFQFMQRAYDAGARRMFFWSGASYVSFDDQIQLTTDLMTYIAENPRGDMDALLHAADIAVALPSKYCMSLFRYDYLQNESNLNDEGVSYVAVIQAAKDKIGELNAANEIFDLVIADSDFDSGSYGTVYWVRENATVDTGMGASFTVDINEGIAPLQVQFTDTSVGEIISWLWDFGDGATSTEQNPTHIYTIPGIYTASLTITTPTGTDIASIPISVFEEMPTPASFTVDKSEGVAPLVVQFIDTTEGEVLSWLWDFGDAIIDNVNRNPTHTYTTPGTYTASLTIYSPGGSSIASVDIRVLEQPVASFTVDKSKGNIPLEVQFINTSIGNFTSWLWDFGDGTTSIEDNPVHVYTVAGNYNASLTIFFPEGSSTASEIIIAVEPFEPPPPSPSSAPAVIGLVAVLGAILFSRGRKG